MPAGQAAHEGADPLALGVGEPRERLVQQEHLGLGRERDRDLEEPLLAVGEGGRLLRGPRLEPHDLEEVPRPPDDLAERPRVAPERTAMGRPGLDGDPHVLEDAQISEDAHDLNDVAPLEQDLAAVGGHEARQHVEEGRLAGAVRADEAVELPRAEVEVDSVGDHEGAEALLEGADREDGAVPGRERTPVVSARGPDGPRRDLGAREMPARPPAEAGPEAGEALGGEEHEGHQEGAEDEPPVLRVRAELVAQEDEEAGPQKGPRKWCIPCRRRRPGSGT